jgi:hypothetical protein
MVVDGREPVVDLNLLVVGQRLPVADPNLLVVDQRLPVVGHNNMADDKPITDDEFVTTFRCIESRIDVCIGQSPLGFL